MRIYVIPQPMRSRIPDYTVEELERWVNHAKPLSGFYWCLLSGDIWGAAEQADDENMAALGYILKLMVEDFPADAFGSPEKLKTWRGWANMSWGEDEENEISDASFIVPDDDGDFGEASDYPEKER